MLRDGGPLWEIRGTTQQVIGGLAMLAAADERRPFFAEAIRRIHYHDSVSSLFD